MECCGVLLHVLVGLVRFDHTRALFCVCDSPWLIGWSCRERAALSAIRFVHDLLFILLL